MERDYRMYEPLFGSWYIIKQIGSGAAGSVYEIERTDEFGVTVHSAMKASTIPSGGETEIQNMLFTGMSEEELRKYYEEAVNKVADELRLITRLRGNSHIVSYEDHAIIAHEEGIGWDILMRMELLTPLTEHYNAQKFSENEVLKMGIDLCKGLELCSVYGIVHRDIKPSNIFVSSSGDYKLGDFGIARIIEESQSSFSRKGTYTYMAPEVYRGKEYGQAADIYSLGMVLYQCLNDGRNLFMPSYPDAISLEDSEHAFAKRIVSSEIPAPSHGSERFKQIVQKACALDPKDRYQTAEEMRLDMEQAAQGSVQKQKQNLTRRSKTKMIIAAALAAALALAAVIYAVIPHEIESIKGIKANTEIYIGDTLSPEYVITPDRFKDEPISFSSSDEDIIKVDSKGAITAFALGEADMQITADEYTRMVHITVVPKVTEISGVDDEIALTTGNSIQIDPQLAPEKFSDEEITYKSGDEAVAVITGDGSLTAVAAGQTQLTIEAGGFSRIVTVTVTDPVPVVHHRSGGSSGSSKSRSSGSSGSDKGYFDESDNEYF